MNKPEKIVIVLSIFFTILAIFYGYCLITGMILLHKVHYYMIIRSIIYFIITLLIWENTPHPYRITWNTIIDFPDIPLFRIIILYISTIIFLSVVLNENQLNVFHGVTQLIDFILLVTTLAFFYDKLKYKLCITTLIGFLLFIF